jgi:hypothetical protein
VNGSENAPELLMDAVPSVIPHPLTLIDVQPTQSLAEAVTVVPGGPWAGERVGAL